MQPASERPAGLGLYASSGADFRQAPLCLQLVGNRFKIW